MKPIVLPAGTLLCTNFRTLRITHLRVVLSSTMADVQIRDEIVRDRVRAAEEFLDPSMLNIVTVSSVAAGNVI